MRTRPTVRRTLIGIAAALMTATLVAPREAAATSHDRRLDRLLEELWIEVLETPASQNPYANADADDCWEIGRRDGIVAPMGPNGVDHCTVPAGTSVFVILTSIECSDVEGDATVEERIACAQDAQDALVTRELYVDGRRVRDRAVFTDEFQFTLPTDNVLGGEPGTVGNAVASGYVALLPPLRPGNHTLTIDTSAADGDSITTTITVERHR